MKRQPTPRENRTIGACCPSLNLSRQLGDDWKFVASYSHRTRKPDVYQLNPRFFYSTVSAYRGNLRLRTQDTDSFEIGYEYGRRRFSSEGSLYYRRNEHEIISTQEWINSQTVVSSFVNAANSHSLGAEFTAKGELGPKANYSLNVNVFDTQIAGVVGGVSLQRQAVTYSGNAIVELKPTPHDWVQLSLNAQGKTPTLQGYTSGYSRLDLIYRHRLARHWILSLRGFDLANTSRQRTVFSTPDGEGPDYPQHRAPGRHAGRGLSVRGRCEMTQRESFLRDEANHAEVDVFFLETCQRQLMALPGRRY
ncbi:TonB-dependent receptor domain-containing protein [Caulobacter segnis]